MKKIITLLMAALLALHSIAQTTSPQVVSSSGWYATGGGVSLSQTIGEMSMVQTFSQTSTTLTQGFEQPELISTGILDFATSGGALTLFPNPAKDHFELNYTFSKEGELTASIYNALGQKVSQDLTDNYHSGDQKLQINSSSLPAGLYFVKTTFTTADGDQYETTKRIEIIK